MVVTHRVRPVGKTQIQCRNAAIVVSRGYMRVVVEFLGVAHATARRVLGDTRHLARLWPRQLLPIVRLLPRPMASVTHLAPRIQPVGALAAGSQTSARGPFAQCTLGLGYVASEGMPGKTLKKERVGAAGLVGLPCALE